MGEMHRARGNLDFTIRHVSIDMDKRVLNLPLGPGVNVLYGRNGVGKTRILGQILHGCVTLSFDSDFMHAGDRFRPLCRISHFGSEPLAAAEAFSHDSLQSRGYWEETIDGPLTDVVERLREVADRFAFVDRLDLPEQVRTRVWGILLAIVGRDSTDDPQLLVEAILEILGTTIISVSPETVTYRVLLSAETPALKTLVERTNRLLRERYEYLEATKWENGTDGWLEWLNVVLYAGSGGLLQHLVDDPFDDESQAVPPSIGELPIGVKALTERTEPRSPFEFIKEDSTDLRELTEAWVNAVVLASDQFAAFAVDRIDDEEDRCSFKRDVAATGREGTDERRLAVEAWFSGTNLAVVDEYLFDLNGPTQTAADLAERASKLASEVFTRLLDKAPRLLLVGNPIRVWESEGRFSWWAVDPTGTQVTLGQLSATQRRWAEFAISLALSTAEKKQVALIDEPELGLHRSAEQHLLTALHEIAAARDMTVIVASHSPAFLRPDICTLHHVDREPETKLPYIRPMRPLQASRIAELGLVASDLLQHVRTVLLVEGEHDRWVLEGLFADQFSQHGVLIIPMRGAKALKATADAQLLFDYTSAQVVVMLDNESTERVEMIWNAAVVAQQRSASEASLVALLKELGDGRTVEGKALQEFCVRAITGHAANRVGFQMLSKADIIEYFAPDAFIRRSSASSDMPSWSLLRAEHEQWCEENRGAKADFKSWLARTYRARFDERTFRRAVSGQDAIHDDFIAVLSRVASN